MTPALRDRTHCQFRSRRQYRNMARIFALLLIGLVIGGSVGFVIGADFGAGQPEVPSADTTAHRHGAPLILTESDDVPEVRLAVEPDPVSGWNLNIQVERFVFAAERAGLAHVPGEGHAHIYVNGEKRARAYGPWVHIDALPPGAVEITVTLNTNDHRDLLLGGAVLSASVTVQNP